MTIWRPAKLSRFKPSRVLIAFEATNQKGLKGPRSRAFFVVADRVGTMVSEYSATNRTELIRACASSHIEWRVDA